MSHIKWTDLSTGDYVYVSGAERAHLALTLDPMHVGSRADAFVDMLNTAVVRAPVLRLSARIHGQCELGLWVHPKDHAWFADRIMESLQTIVKVTGRDGTYWTDVFRSGMSTYRDGVGDGGWLCLADWLRRGTGGGKVVASYSVTGRPSRQGTRRALRLCPDTFDTYVFS